MAPNVRYTMLCIKNECYSNILNKVIVQSNFTRNFYFCKIEFKCKKKSVNIFATITA